MRCGPFFRAPIVLHSDRAGGRRARLVRCHDAPAEARAIADAVLTAVQDGHRLREQAVLMRTSHHSDLLEVELTARHVPFVKFGGLKFLEAAHVKDFVAAIRLLDNTLDEVAWYRLLRLHDGIGPARARILLQQLDRGEIDEPAAHAEAVAAAPAISRVALAATLDALAVARGQRRIGDRATTCVDLLRPLLTARYPDSVVAHRRPRAAGRRGRERTRSRRLRRGADAGPTRVHRRSGRPAAPG